MYMFCLNISLCLLSQVILMEEPTLECVYFPRYKLTILRKQCMIIINPQYFDKRTDNKHFKTSHAFLYAQYHSDSMCETTDERSIVESSL